jgi:hypothetical protein
MISALDDAATLFDFLRSEGKSIKEALAIHSRCFTSNPSTGELERNQVPYILQATCEVCGVTLEDLLGPRRTAKIANARMVAVYRLRSTALTLEQAGAAVGITRNGAHDAVKRVESSPALMDLAAAVAKRVAENVGEPTTRAAGSWPRRAIL